MCKGDSGGGLAFPKTGELILRYYLRGVVSTAPRINKTSEVCNPHTYTTFTKVSKHEHFIKPYLNTDSCKLPPHPSVTYHCNGPLGSKLCANLVPSGTVVRPECNPNYRPTAAVGSMTCVNGAWDYLVICQPEYGKSTIDSRAKRYGTASRGELPWHARVYDKRAKPYLYICGGSLVTTTVVISAAHCFWTDALGLLPPSLFAVALGKIYRPWHNPMDKAAQKFDVADIAVPPGFSGEEGLLRGDIALLALSAPAVLTDFIRPICINFDQEFERKQLVSGNTGVMAGWGLSSAVLQVIEVTYMDQERCLADLPPDFRQFLTSDKFCARTENGPRFCTGVGGGGVAMALGRWRALRGVAAAAAAAAGFSARLRLAAHARSVEAYLLHQ